MERIEERVIDGHRLHVQTESVRGEGSWSYVECCSCRYQSSCEVLRRNREIIGDESGRGAYQKVQAQLRRLQ